MTGILFLPFMFLFILSSAFSSLSQDEAFGRLREPQFIEKKNLVFPPFSGLPSSFSRALGLRSGENYHRNELCSLEVHYFINPG
jgi:hypothetical protein